MLYDVRMTIGYAYGGPVSGGRHLLRLVPAAIPGRQRIIAAGLEVRPSAAARSDGSDFFGNATCAVTIAIPHDRIDFVLRARVERLPAPALFDGSPLPAALAEEIAAVASLAPDAPHHFLPPSPRIAPLPALRDWARAVATPGMTTLETVTAINAAIHGGMRYDPSATTVDTPMAEAFAARHGVCQDFSHVMIGALRELGIPAAYVSGFLRTEPPPGQPRLEGADAMHAWVSAWCGAETGWVDFDPTNRLVVSQDHVTVARGRDYSDVAPVRGVLRIAGSQHLHQSVDLIPVTKP